MVENFKNLFFCLIFLFSVFFGFDAYSKAKPFAVEGFANFQTKSVYRGALYWNSPSYFLGPGFVFYDKFFLRGPNLFYQYFTRKDKFKLNFSVQSFNDRRPFLRFSSDEESLKNSRSHTFDFTIDTAYKFGFRNLFEIGSKISRDFIEHKGMYFQPYFQMPVAPFVKLNTSLGVGEKSVNQYLYGQRAESGLAYYGLSLSAFVPRILPGVLILSLDYTSVIGSKNRGGELIEGKPDNLNFAMRFFCFF